MGYAYAYVTVMCVAIKISSGVRNVSPIKYFQLRNLHCFITVVKENDVAAVITAFWCLLFVISLHKAGREVNNQSANFVYEIDFMTYPVLESYSKRFYLSYTIQMILSG